MRVAIIVAASLFALPAAAQSDGFSRGFNDGYRTGFPAPGHPMSPYVSGTENGAGARFLDDEDDARRQRAAEQRQQEQRATEEAAKSCVFSGNPSLPFPCR